MLRSPASELYFSVSHFTSLAYSLFFCVVTGLEALLHLRIVSGDKIQF